MAHQRTTPYDTGKVKIGCAYTPPPRRYFSAEEEHVQNILLEGHYFDPWDRVILGLAAAVAIVSAIVLLLGH